MHLHLIRHGETTWNAEQRTQGQSESELTDRGRQQADAVRSSIEALPIVSVYSSSSVRTRETTDIIVRNIADKGRVGAVLYRDDLRELYLASWETRLWTELEAEWPSQVEDFRNNPHLFNFEGAETFEQLKQRGMAAIESIVEIESAQPDDADILVVSHGAIIKALLAGFADVDLAQLWAPPSLDNCSHSILYADAAGAREVRQIGGVAYEKCDWHSLNS